MRIITTALLALGFAGAMAIGAPSPSAAQGLYYSGPGVQVEVNRPWRHRHHHRYYRYRDYDDYYAYAPGYRTWNGCPPHYTIQDGACKPYRGY